jgi:NAD(P)H-dependent FMN reductase
VSERIGSEIEVQITPLLDYEMKPCRMCGECFTLGECARDKAFNQLYRQLVDSDGIFLVCPHYAPFPSKVMILLEKLQEMIYLKSCADPSYQFPLSHKPVGIIVHGGQTEEALPYYRAALLEPLANALASVQMRVIGADDEWARGIAFGIQRLTLPSDSIFVSIEHDWPQIEQRVEKLVEKVIAAAEKHV